LNFSEISVIGVPDPKFGERIKAVCALTPKSELTEQEVIDFVAGKLLATKSQVMSNLLIRFPKRKMVPSIG